MQRERQQGGSAIIEFTLTGIMLMFVWISIVQMAIGMWRYSTMQYATQAAGAYTAVHGQGCILNGNLCSIKIRDAARIIRTSAPGLEPESTNLVFSAISKTNHSSVLASHSCRLDACLTDATPWPLATFAAAGQEFSIHVDYLYNSGIAMWVPGVGGAIFGPCHLPAHTQQMVMY